MSRDRWQELDAAATRGPWHLGSDSVGDAVWLQVETDDGETIVSSGTRATEGSNMTFIAAARTAWPAAERECEQLRALLRQVRAALTAEAEDTTYTVEGWREALLLIDSAGLDLGSDT